MSELDAYDFELPRELIAQEPLEHRADARLLVVNRHSQSLDIAHVRDLPDFLHEPDLLVLNNTQVIPARLVGRREQTGGRWTGLYLGADDQGTWKVLGKTRGRLRPLETVVLEDRDSRPQVTLSMLAPIDEGVWAAKPVDDRPPLEILADVGRVPLPPYIRSGEMMDSDVVRYQTVYAEEPGAVAAPTAGLHFTEPLLEQLARQGVGRADVTLHVGIGTFRPIKAERLDDHQMHSEWAQVSLETAEKMQAARADNGRVVAVGTTVVRSLESAANKTGVGHAWTGETDLFVRPPYDFQAVDCLLTNFHLPKSTLLILVSAFAGAELIRKAYQLAIREEFRFFSYGDAMLIL